MIEVQNISFAYGDLQVLRNVSFTVPEDESLVIMGPSGSGKSTILRLVLGLDCPQEGKILVDGANICIMKEKEKQEMRKQIGMVFQDGALFDSMTVGENVGYYLLEHTNMPWEKITQKVREMLEFVGLDPAEVADKLPEQLSGGQRRRIAIGRALLSTNPRVMLYDEPTTGLDPTSNENVLKLIMKLNEDLGVSSIVVTHQIADAFWIANRFLVIYDGEVAFIGTLDELRASQDKHVRDFLAPFRASIEEVLRLRFIKPEEVGPKKNELKREDLPGE